MGRQGRAYLLGAAASLLALLPGWHALALDLAQQPFELRRWDGTDGVHAIAQGRDGILWFGSRTGLTRFDGDRFLEVDRGDEPRTSGAWVRRVLAASDGSLWVADGSGELAWETSPRPHLARRHGATTGRLSRLWPFRPVSDPDRARRFSSADGLPSDWIWALAEDHAGDVWIGTEAGLARFRAGRMEVAAAVASGDSVTALAVAPDGALHVATSAGVLVRPAGASSFQATPIREPVLALTADRAGRLWALAHLRLLRLDRDGRLATFPVPTGTSLAVDADDNLWVGGTVRVFARGEPAPLDWPGVPPDVTDVLGDREGSVWFGKRDGQIVQAWSPRVRNVVMPGSLASFTLMRARDRSMYVTTTAGIGRYLDGAWTLWPRGLENGTASRDLGEGPPGAPSAGIWIGDEHGIWRQIGQRFVQVKPARVPAGTARLNLLVTRSGDVWVGWRDNGLYRFSDGDLSRVPLALGVPDGLCTAGLTGGVEAADGSLWFSEGYDGERPAGVSRIVDGRARCYTSAHGLPPAHIGAVAEDRDGTIWLGTGWGAGLVRFRDDQFTTIRSQAGLPRANITGIIDDGQGHLWIGSENGVWRAPKVELAACAEGRCDGLDASAVAFGKEEGMRTPECTGAYRPNMAVDARGDVWVATLRGVSVFSPTGRDARAVVTPVIEAAAIDGVAVRVGEEVRLGPGQRDLVLRYTAATFVGPRPRLMHRLQGFDAEWLPAAAQPVAHYHDLAEGRYTFEIRAGSSVVRALTVVAAPPFWRTRSFVALVAVLLVAAGALVYRLRLARQRAQLRAASEERSRIARDLHDGLAQKLTAMGLLADRARLDRSERPPLPELAQLRQILDESHAELRRAIWDMRREDDQGRPAAQQRLEPLLERVLAQVVVPPGMEVRLDSAESSWPVGGLLAHEAPLVVKEALTNALRHAQARVIEIGVLSDEDGVDIWVRDDGRGMPAPTAAAADGRYGLIGMYERARRVGGELEVRSRSGQGTEVRLSVPRARAGGAGGSAR